MRRPSPSILAFTEDLFKDGCRDAATITTRRKETSAVVRWCTALGYDTTNLTPMIVSSFLHDQRSRGHTVPGKAWDGLRWGAKVFGFEWHI